MSDKHSSQVPIRGDSSSSGGLAISEPRDAGNHKVCSVSLNGRGIGRVLVFNGILSAGSFKAVGSGTRKLEAGRYFGSLRGAANWLARNNTPREA